MTDLIRQRLRELEEEYGFRILYACESGSRAWGFASADSDYDVRVVYAWPRERYLGVLPPPEAFDRGVDADALDVSGWDLRKALGLFRKSNGPLLEWLFSPIVYFEDANTMVRWRELAESCFVPARSAAHYLGLSSRIDGGIRGAETSTAKSYLYVLRALLGANHVVEHGTPPPVEFGALLRDAALPPDVRREIDAMVAGKAGGLEGDRLPRNPLLDGFIDERSEAVRAKAATLPSETCPVDGLDRFFRSVIG